MNEKVLCEKSDLVAIADAVREATGSTENYNVSELSAATIEAISASGTGGGSGVVNIIESENPTKADLGNFTQLGKVSFPNAESIGDYSFWDCAALTSVDLPVATITGNEAFAACAALKSVNLPVATIIGNEAFAACAALKSVNLPVATIIGNSAFATCAALKSVNLPVATSIRDGAFIACAALKSVNLPVATIIGNSAFAACAALSALILRTTETVCSIDVTALLGTKILTEEGLPTGEGFVYIPTSMDAAYRAAYEPVFEELGAAGLYDILFRKIEDWPEICG